MNSLHLLQIRTDMENRDIAEIVGIVTDIGM